jgi:hypothetical protein
MLLLAARRGGFARQRPTRRLNMPPSRPGMQESTSTQPALFWSLDSSLTNAPCGNRSETGARHKFSIAQKLCKSFEFCERYLGADQLRLIYLISCYKRAILFKEHGFPAAAKKELEMSSTGYFFNPGGLTSAVACSKKQRVNVRAAPCSKSPQLCFDIRFCFVGFLFPGDFG